MFRHGLHALWFAVAAALIAACAQTPRKPARPDWVDGVSTRYPADQYLIGRGQGSERATAMDRARADLAKNFAVLIQERTTDTQTFTSGGATDAGEATLEVARALETRTETVLRGTEVPEIWQDPATRSFHALAVLSRARAGQALRQEIQSLDDGTRAFLAQAQGTDDLFRKIAAARRALEAQRTRAGLQAMLQAVDLTGRGVPAPWTLGKLEADLAELMARVRVSATAEGRDRDDVARMLAGALAAQGMTVADEAPYRMSAALDYDFLPPRDGWHWVRGTLTVELRGADGTVQGTRRWELKESATDRETARRRLYEKADALLRDNVRDVIFALAKE
ncbi:MAG TPA: LPP20 family lipoprotein [Gammaproteobacteria bacterium]|nr:LPP20 family lipoprotein [Gammaproteobacteria bacterium]